MKYLKNFENLEKQKEEALSWAVTKNYKEFIEFLEKDGVSSNNAFLDACNNYDGIDNSLILKLINKVDDINCEKYNMNCIDLIVRKKVDKELIELFISKGAKTDNALYYYLKNMHYKYNLTWEKVKNSLDYLISIGSNINSKEIVKDIHTFFSKEREIKENLLQYLIKNGLDIMQKYNDKYLLIDWIMNLSADFSYLSGSYKKALRSEEMQEWFIENQPQNIIFLQKHGIVFKKELLKKHKELFNAMKDSDDLGLLENIFNFFSKQKSFNDLTKDEQDNFISIMETNEDFAEVIRNILFSEKYYQNIDDIEYFDEYDSKTKELTIFNQYDFEDYKESDIVAVYKPEDIFDLLIQENENNKIVNKLLNIGNYCITICYYLIGEEETQFLIDNKELGLL